MPLNMTNLKKTEEWASEKRVWCLSDIYATVAKVAFSLSDGYPRNFETVMCEFMTKFRDLPEIYLVGETQMIGLPLDELRDVVYSILCSIKAFREWNLTTLEYLNGVDVDGGDRNNEWFGKSNKDFIDLEAFKQNIYLELRSKLIEEYFFEI